MSRLAGRGKRKVSNAVLMLWAEGLESVRFAVPLASFLAVTSLLPGIGVADPDPTDLYVGGVRHLSGGEFSFHSITVAAGGSLTVQDSMVRLASKDGMRGSIEVMAGANFTAHNSTFSQAQPDEPFHFRTFGNRFELHGSTVIGAGECKQDAFHCVLNPEHQGLVVGTSSARIENSTFDGGGIGVLVVADGVVIANNTFRGSEAGGVGVTGNETSILNNSIFLDRSKRQDPRLTMVGVSAWRSRGHLISGNAILTQPYPDDTGLNNDWGIHANGVADLDIQLNTIRGLRPVGVWVFDEVRVKNNTIQGREQGVVFMFGRHAQATGNDIQGDSADGVRATHVLGGVISENRIDLRNHSRWGPIVLDRSDGIHVSSNDIQGPWPSMEKSEKGRCMCILITGTSNSSIEGNEAVGLAEGIVLHAGSTRNTIVGNRISSGRGVALLGSSGNTIARNAFMDGVVPSYGGMGNAWYHGGMGNYWETDALAVPDAPLLSVEPPVENVAAPPGLAIYPQTLWMGTDTTILGPLVSGQTIDVESHHLRSPDGTDLVIRNSTIILGRRGFAEIGAGHEAQGNVTIEDSRIIAASPGYGGSISMSSASTIAIRRSHLSGLALEDMVFRNLVIEDSTIEGALLVSGQPNDGRGSLVIKNSTFRGIAEGLKLWVPTTEVRDSTFEYTVLLSGFFRAPDLKVYGNTFAGSLAAPNVFLNVPQGGAPGPVEGNVFANAPVGLLVSGRGLRVTGNDFGGNLFGVWGNTDAHQFDRNYWDNYPCQDRDGDGVGDKPFGLGRVADLHPLMRPSRTLPSVGSDGATLPPGRAFSLWNDPFTDPNPSCPAGIPYPPLPLVALAVVVAARSAFHRRCRNGS